MTEKRKGASRRSAEERLLLLRKFEAIQDGTTPIAELLKRLGIPKSTYYRWIREEEILEFPTVLDDQNAQMGVETAIKILSGEKAADRFDRVRATITLLVWFGP